MFDKTRKSIRSNLLWTEGRVLLKALAMQTIIYMIALLFFPVTKILGLFLGVFLQVIFYYYFFRNPVRVQIAYDAWQLLCPADGKVIEIDKGHVDNNFSQRVSIFLSPLDVHVQWVPMPGVIKKINYREGSFTPAFFTKSDYNERNEIIIDGRYGMIAVRQIAGFLARRIACWVAVGDEVTIGQKFGMIRFGSRVDVLMPKNVLITVNKGQWVRGGVTQLGMWQDREKMN